MSEAFLVSLTLLSTVSLMSSVHLAGVYTVPVSLVLDSRNDTTDRYIYYILYHMYRRHLIIRHQSRHCMHTTRDSTCTDTTIQDTLLETPDIYVIISLTPVLQT